MSPDRDVLVKVEGISKKFCRDLKRSLWYGLGDVSASFFGRKKGVELRKDEFFAVNDVSFELRRGDCLGLIGHNGAGKSTLLKMLNGLIKPDKGKITMYGRVGALIELGAGFNPILSGRENIYINAQILGFTKQEVDEKLPAIIEFAEIGDFLDAPVQNYSSGMKVRLGFAIAAQMEPDVLIIDEVLAVGDLGFRIKCLNRINELISSSAVIFVSHSMPQVSRVCNRGLLLCKGESLKMSNDLGEIINDYFNLFGESEKGGVTTDDSRLIEMNVLNRSNENVREIRLNDDLKIELKLAISSKIERYNLRVFFVNQEMRNVLEVPSDIVLGDIVNPFLEHELKIEIPNLPLNVGKYGISLVLVNSISGDRVFRLENVKSISVTNPKYISWADSMLKANWKILS